MFIGNVELNAKKEFKLSYTHIIIKLLSEIIKYLKSP
jgi:hypothetical protein